MVDYKGLFYFDIETTTNYKNLIINIKKGINNKNNDKYTFVIV